MARWQGSCRKESIADIKSILHLIPTDAKQYYKNLVGEEMEEDVEGFNGEVDFEIEEENQD